MEKYYSHTTLSVSLVLSIRELEQTTTATAMENFGRNGSLIHVEIYQYKFWVDHDCLIFLQSFDRTAKASAYVYSAMISCV